LELQNNKEKILSLENDKTVCEETLNQQISKLILQIEKEKDKITSLQKQLEQAETENVTLTFNYNNIINNDLYGLIDTFNRFLDSYEGYREQLFLTKSTLDNDFKTKAQRQSYAARLSNLYSYILFGLENVITRTSVLDRYTNIDKTPKEFVEAVCYTTLSFYNGMYKH